MPTVTTDDEIYRVNPVWLGPPKATMPFRARYVSWGVGITLSVLVFALARIWFPFGFWSLAWSLVAAVALTRLIGAKITHERGLGSVLGMAVREITTPRQHHEPTGGAAAAGTVRIRAARPRPTSGPPSSDAATATSEAFPTSQEKTHG